MPVSSILASIEGWLAAHAPETLRALAPPATERDIAGLEQALDMDLNPDVLAMLTWHNGSGEAFPPFDVALGFALLGTDDVVFYARLRANADNPDFPAWNRLWVPVASDGCGAQLVVDHADGRNRGRVMLSDPEDGANFRETWPSLEDVLTQTFGAIRDGHPFLDSTCFVQEGRLFWDTAE